MSSLSVPQIRPQLVLHPVFRYYSIRARRTGCAPISRFHGDNIANFLLIRRNQGGTLPRLTLRSCVTLQVPTRVSNTLMQVFFFLNVCVFIVCPPQRWVVSRQMRFEGGFQGRCNKLVDGCYSFWQAGLLPLLHRALFKEGTASPRGQLGSNTATNRTLN